MGLFLSSGCFGLRSLRSGVLRLDALQRYAEFLDNVQAYAYFPYAVAKGIDDFRGGEISFRFKPVAGRIDQGAGILFNLKPNGDYR